MCIIIIITGKRNTHVHSMTYNMMGNPFHVDSFDIDLIFQ